MTAAPNDAGLPDGARLDALPLDRARALGNVDRRPLDGLDLDALLDAEAHDLGWQEQAVDHTELQWARDLPGVYAAAAPALTTGPHHRWLDADDGGRADLVIDARRGPAWLMLPSAGHVTVLRLEGPTVQRVRLPLAQWDLPRPPVEAWPLADQPDWLRQRTHADLAGVLPRRAAAVGRLLRLRHRARGLHALQALRDDPTRPIRRWWAQLPAALLERIETQAVAAARPLQAAPPAPDLPLLLLRDDLESLRWLLRTHPGGCDRLDAVLDGIDRRAPRRGAAARDPQLAEASWREPDAWWACP